MTRSKETIIVWIIIFVLSAAAFFGIFFGRGNISAEGTIDAFSIPGVVTVLLGCLIWVEDKGAFDMFVFGFGSIFSHMSPDPDHISKYNDYIGYLDKKREKRQYHRPILLPFFVIGGLFVAVALIIDFAVMANLAAVLIAC